MSFSSSIQVRFGLFDTSKLLRSLKEQVKYVKDTLFDTFKLVRKLTSHSSDSKAVFCDTSKLPKLLKPKDNSTKAVLLDISKLLISLSLISKNGSEAKMYLHSFSKNVKMLIAQKSKNDEVINSFSNKVTSKTIPIIYRIKVQDVFEKQSESNI